MKLLITGIPGTGKTTIGEYLRANKGYEHFNMERELVSQSSFSAAIEAFLEAPGENKVITWGFRPGVDDAGVKQLQALGFQMIWFDGNREAARKAFLKRGDVGKELLDRQMALIGKMNLPDFQPIIFNTFDPAGNFFKEETIVGLLLDGVPKSAV